MVIFCPDVLSVHAISESMFGAKDWTVPTKNGLKPGFFSFRFFWKDVNWQMQLGQVFESKLQKHEGIGEDLIVTF